MTTTAAGQSRQQLFHLGKPFIHPLFDLMLIGGGLSLVTVLAVVGSGRMGQPLFPMSYFPWLVLLANSTHFAASTVRLYSKPGSFAELPFLTMGLPLATLLVLTVAIVFSDSAGMHLHGLYLTWSPFHYAAQAYGLAAMYSMRSGCKLGEAEQGLLWWTCMLPFLYALVVAPNSGLAWLLPSWLLVEEPAVAALRGVLGRLLAVATFLAPAYLVLRVYRNAATGLPLISLLLIVTNGIWWVLFTYWNAFGWATVFHGVQYLAIVLVFHLRDHPAPAGSRRGWIAPTARFYLACLVLGYALFEIWPYAYVWAGFTLAESMLLCTAAINIHHFVVDRGIWRLRKDKNYRIVVGDEAVPARA